jgi:hypothetical protein
MRKFYIVLVLAFFLIGCGAESEPKYKLILPAGTPSETVELLSQVMPDIEQHFPGVLTYYDKMDFVSVQPARKIGLCNGAQTTAITLEFKVKDDAALPSSVKRSRGHHVFIDVGVDGKTLSVAKRAAVSILQDRPFEDVEQCVLIEL